MSHNLNDANVSPAMPSPGVVETLEVVDTNAASGTRVAEIEIDCVVSSCSVPKYKKCYRDKLDARRFGATFSDEAITFMFDRRNVRRDTDVGAWNWQWTHLRRWCSGTLRDGFGFDMVIVCHAKEVSYLRRLLRLVRNVEVMSEYRRLDLCCIVDPMDECYLVMVSDARWRKLEFKGRQRHRARRLWFVGWQNIKMFALLRSKLNEIPFWYHRLGSQIKSFS